MTSRDVMASHRLRVVGYWFSVIGLAGLPTLLQLYALPSPRPEEEPECFSRIHALRSLRPRSWWPRRPRRALLIQPEPARRARARRRSIPPSSRATSGGALVPTAAAARSPRVA